MIATQMKNELPNLWYAMGRTTAWPNEDIPPAEDMFTTNLDEIIGFKKFEVANLVAPLSNIDSSDINGDVISYKSQDWKIVSDADAVKYGARYVYLSVTLNPGDLPYNVYRQVGVYLNVKPLSTVASKTNTLVPTQVSDSGTMLGYDNRLFQRYSDNMKITENIVLKF